MSITDGWIDFDQFCDLFGNKDQWVDLIEGYIDNAAKANSGAPDYVIKGLLMLKHSVTYGLFVDKMYRNLQGATHKLCLQWENNGKKVIPDNLVRLYKLARCLNDDNYKRISTCIAKDSYNMYYWYSALIGGIINAGIWDVSIIIALLGLVAGIDDLQAWIDKQTWIPDWIKNIVDYWLSSGKKVVKNEVDKLEKDIQNLVDAIAGQNQLIKSLLDNGLNALWNTLDKVGKSIGDQLYSNISKLVNGLIDQEDTITNNINDGNKQLVKSIEDLADKQNKATNKALDNIIKKMETNNDKLVNTMTVSYQTMYASAMSVGRTFIGIGLQPFTVTDPETNKTKSFNLFEVPLKVMAEMMLTAGDPVDSYIKRLMQSITGAMTQSNDPYTISAGMLSTSILQATKLQLAQMKALTDFNSDVYKQRQKALMQANQELRQDMLAQVKAVADQIKQQTPTSIINNKPNNEASRGGF